MLVFKEGIYKSTNGGATWQVYTNNSISSFLDLAIDPNNAQILYGTPVNSGSFAGKSSDGGVSWTTTELPTGSLYVNPVDSNIVYSVGLLGVEISLDGGNTVNGIGPSLPSNTAMRGFPLGFAIDTSNYNTLYLAADGVYKYY